MAVVLESSSLGKSAWPFVPVLSRIVMATSMGIFIGLEREHRQKTGVRTFALSALLGCLGGLMGNLFAAIAMGFVAMTIIGMNYREMIHHEKLVLTTSVAIMIVGFSGILFGQGHVFTPAVACVVTAALLAWKRSISDFAVGLSDQELRAAILLAIFTIVIYPVLPSKAIDPWGLVEPKENWVSVIIIAGIGFVNYVLMKILGARGMEITAFFGGLVNSRKVIVELGMRSKEMGSLLFSTVQRGILLATAAMLIRNVLIIAALASMAVSYCVIPLLSMLLVNAYLWWRIPMVKPAGEEAPPLSLESPFKLSAALKFGLVFLILNVVGALAQRYYGAASFYFVSAMGGLLSSASSIASAATLISRHELPISTGVNGIILSSLTSILSNLPLIRTFVKETKFQRKIYFSLVLIAVIGLIAGIANYFIFETGIGKIS